MTKWLLFVVDLVAVLLARGESVRRIPQVEVVTWRACSIWQDMGVVPSETLIFPSGLHPALVSFLTTDGIGGDLSGDTITATVAVESIGVPTFVYGYEGQPWNTCPAPASVRLYFTTVAGSYDLSNADEQYTNYWWSTSGMSLCSIVGDFAILSNTLADPSAWSDSRGVSGADEPKAFFAAAHNVAQVGFSFGGGCFYDTGVGVAKDSSATFIIKNFVCE